MRNKMLVIVTIVSALALALAACSPQEVKTTVEVTREVEVTRIVEQEGETVVVTAVPTPDPEAVIEDVEDRAEITLWTFWLSPFPASVPRRHGQLGRSPGHLPGRSAQRFCRRERARRHQPVPFRGLGQ